MMEKSLFMILFFALLLFSVAFASAPPEQLSALITEEKIQEVLTQAQQEPVFDDKDALYYSKSVGDTYYSSVCHGGSESLGCKERAVRLETNYYKIENPTSALGIGGAHYLNTKTDDYLVVKLLGELWFIKPHWNDPEQKDSCYFDVWKWTPSENFFIDGSYDLSACEGQGSTVFPKSEDFQTVSAYERSCGVVFDSSCRSGSWITGTDIAIENIKINPQYFEELKARAQSRESHITQAQQTSGECGFKIESINYNGQTYSNPTSLTYDAETAEPMNVSFVIDNSKCTIQQMVFGLWESAELGGYPAIDLHAGSTSLNSLNENGTSAIEVSFSDALNWPKKYMAAKALVLPANSSSTIWITTPAVEITFSSGSASGGTTGGTGGQQPLQDCSVCNTLLQCLACIDMLILQSLS